MNVAIPRVIAVGGPNSLELSNHLGGTPLQHVCRLFGYEAAAYRVQDFNALRRTIKFIGTLVRVPAFESDPLFVHISVDGDASSLEIGPDRAPWGQLTLMIANLFHGLESYSPPLILALSARGAQANEFTRLLLKYGRSTPRKPDHMFLFFDRIPTWTDAILAWAHFYGEARAIDFAADSVANASDVHNLRARMSRLGVGAPSYLSSATDYPR